MISKEASSSAVINVLTVEKRGRNMLLENPNVSSLFPGIVSVACKLTGISVSLSNFAYIRNFLENRCLQIRRNIKLNHTVLKKLLGPLSRLVRLVLNAYVI